MAAETTEQNAEFFEGIVELLTSERAYAYRTAGSIKVETCWEIGRRIVKQEQNDQNLEDGGERLIENLARHLTGAFGEGFSADDLRNMRWFYVAFPQFDGPRFSALSWEHVIRTMQKVDSEQHGRERLGLGNRLIQSALLVLFVAFTTFASFSYRRYLGIGRTYPYQSLQSVDDALIKAVEDGKVETVQSLLKQGADPNAVLWIESYDSDSRISTQEPWPVLLIALHTVPLRREAYSKIAWLLIQNGADIKVKTSRGDGIPNSFLFWANAYDLDDISVYLIENGADIHSDGDVVVLQAKHKGNEKIVKLLNETGVFEKKTSAELRSIQEREADKKRKIQEEHLKKDL